MKTIHKHLWRTFSLKWEEAEHDLQTRLLDIMLYDTCSGTNIESKKWIQKHFVTNCKIFGELPQRTEQVFMHRK